MAILKAINCKNANSKKFKETLAYIANPEKNDDSNMGQVIDDFELDCFVNRFLHGQQKRKRQFKQIVLSLEAEWSNDDLYNKTLKGRLIEVLFQVERYFTEDGFLAKGVVHSNTTHPHFHLVVETCNALSGKQLSQSKADLSKLKEFVSEMLISNGLSEVIKMKSMTEEQLLSEEESEAIINGTGYWNNGTMEQFSIVNEGYGSQSDICLSDSIISKRKTCEIIPPQKRVMCEIIPPKKRVMCEIIPPKKRVMCKNIPPQKRVMCEIIPPQKRVMCEIIPPQKRVMCEIIPPQKRVMVEIIHQEKRED